jgi:hypothetical protein
MTDYVVAQPSITADLEAVTFVVPMKFLQQMIGDRIAPSEMINAAGRIHASPDRYK